MLLPIRYYGHPDLRKKARSIDTITDEIIRLSQDMIETMIALDGVGIAGPQVGYDLRIFIRRFEGQNPDGEFYLGDPEVILNPILSSPSKETISLSEGCLSIPRFEAKVTRPKRIHLTYQNLKGEIVEEDIDGFLARVTMHENDHLNGVLFIDRISDQDKRRVKPFLQNLSP